MRTNAALRAAVGRLVKKNTDRRYTINGKMVNFVAKFEIDEGVTFLSLEAAEYDTSPDTEYEAWCLLEPIEGTAS